MSAISPADVALEGFKVVRHKPLIILFWGILLLISNVAGLVFMISTGSGAAMADMEALNRQITADPQSVDTGAVLDVLARLLNGFALTVAISLVIGALLRAAAYRAVLNPAQSSFGYLRLGADEFRQFVVSVAISLVLFVVYLLAAVAAGIVGGILAFVLAMISPALIIIPMFLALIAALAAVIYFWTRLSLAGPQTLAEGKLNLFGSWKLTKGRFWPVFGSYFIAAILALVVLVLGLIIASAPTFAIGGAEGFTALSQPDYSSFAAYFTPAMIAYVVVMAFAMAQCYAVFVCPAAAIYRSITGAAEQEVFA
jgi:hypothetical protein